MGKYNYTICGKCGGEKTGSHVSYCAECFATYQREWRLRTGKQKEYNRTYKAKDPERLKGHVRKSYLKKRYQLTEQDIEQLKVEQGGSCKICQNQFSDEFKMHIDHNHETGEVRGLLCHKCNLGIGHFREDIDSLARAIDYLLYYPKENVS